MDTNQALTLLLSLLQQKHSHYNSLMDSTRELEKLAAANDADSFGIQLNIRKNSMDAVDRLDIEISTLLSRLPKPLQEKMRQCLRPSGSPLTLDNPLQTNIFDTSKRNHQLLGRIIEADKSLNRLISPI